MGRAFRSFLFAGVCIALGTWLLLNPRGSRPGPEPVTSSSASAPVTPSASVPSAPPGARSAIGFRTAERLADHFAKHGAEFNAPNADAYLVLAQTLRATPPAGDVLEIVRPTDGVISKFDRPSGAFIAFDADSTIRTFFKPNDGEAYFRRQARRRPN
jgi:pyocin large subunit-like protein